MENYLERTELLLGNEALANLSKARVMIFGVGGVGGYVVEALARCGIGHFTLVDHDDVSESNINRQIIALRSTIGRPKVDVMAERIKDINPNATVEARREFYLPENSDTFDFTNYDYIVDCVDTVAAKIQIILKAKEADVSVISSMGTGNKLDPSRFEITDISKTSVCPLAKVMRHELKKRGITKVKVLYSREEPLKVSAQLEPDSKRRSIPGSVAFVPSSAGLLIASQVVKDLTCTDNFDNIC